MVSLEKQVGDLQKGDIQAQNQFWEQYFPEVYGICVHILKNPTDATDVTVDLLSDFLTDYVHRLSHFQALRSYLRVMASRRALRFKNYRERNILTEQNRLSDLEKTDQEDAIEHALLMPRLEKCLEELSPKSRQVVRMRYTGQKTYERIGGIMGCSKQHINRLVKSSLEMLRSCLEAKSKKPLANQGTGK